MCRIRREKTARQNASEPQEGAACIHKLTNESIPFTSRANSHRGGVWQHAASRVVGWLRPKEAQGVGKVGSLFQVSVSSTL